MSRIRKNYPASFKAKVALAALREDKPIAELAVHFGIHATVIHRWKREALKGMESTFSAKGQKEEIDHLGEVKELHAKIGELTVERDFLANASRRLGLGGGKKW